MYMGSLSAHVHVCVYECIVCVHVSVHPMFNTGPHNIYSNFRRVVLHFSYFIKLTLKKKNLNKNHILTVQMSVTGLLLGLNTCSSHQFLHAE